MGTDKSQVKKIKSNLKAAECDIHHFSTSYPQKYYFLLFTNLN